MRPLVAVVLVCTALLGCGASGGRAAPVSEPTPGSAAPRHASISGPASATAAAGGSSDGTTCEQARDQYVEEVNLQAGTGADLNADDFAAVLNNGSYLNPCDVPSSSKIRICAAVQNGHALGVTVALDPPSTDLEVCVATQVRQLSFPTNPKLDVVNVSF